MLKTLKQCFSSYGACLIVAYLFEMNMKKMKLFGHK